MLCYLFLVLITSSILCMEQEQQAQQQEETQKKEASDLNDDNVEINGKKQSLIQHVLHATQAERCQTSFSTTAVIRYENNKLIRIGDLSDISQDDLSHIAQGNCLYKPYFATEKTRLSRRLYEDIGAIVVGTKNKKLLNELPTLALICSMREWLKEMGDANL